MPNVTSSEDIYERRFNFSFNRAINSAIKQMTSSTQSSLEAVTLAEPIDFHSTDTPLVKTSAPRCWVLFAHARCSSPNHTSTVATCFSPPACCTAYVYVYIARYSDGLRVHNSVPGTARFLFSTASRPTLETLSPGKMRPLRETDHSPASTTEIKKGGTTPPCPRVFMP
jgi:hypothetical protein